MDITEKVLNKLDLDGSLILKKPIRGLEGFTLSELITAIIYTDSIKEAATLLGYSENPVKISIRSVLLPKFPDRSKEFLLGGNSGKWRITLLSSIQHKFCTSCRKIYPYNNFVSHISHDSTSMSSYCKACHTFNNKLQKEAILLRTPIWANLESIKQVYLNCPENHHVDHIIPLRGALVSGLHVEYNLQYLTISDNKSKSNKFIIE